MENLNIRAEIKKDFQSITDVHNLAFKALGEGKLVNLIRGSEFFVPELSIVAEQDGRVVGHVLFSKILLIENDHDLNGLSLAPVAVIPELQRKGIGQKLIHAGIQRAQLLGFTSILVLGDPAYYGKFGFRHELTKGIECRYYCNDFSGLELKPNTLTQIKKASANYPEAFSLVD